jgi:hypothetical protein
VEELKNAQARTSGNIEPEDQFVLLLSASIPQKKDQINKGANLSDIPLS